MKSILFAILSIAFFACSNQPITITKDKIVNGNWSPDPREGRNGMTVQKVTVINDSIDYYLDKGFLNDGYFLGNSSFHYRTHFGKREVKEVNFDSEYDWKWIDVKNKSEISKIGLLENDTCYKFSGLTNNTKFFLYVYIDEKGFPHQYAVNKSNY
ncbi:hypothetical protein LV716_14560 [Flagellimonas sp. HMM57]|uniref:hypothetical protein n=1 Tax=unclassified Flagellimonas TaxID=2644544 RepID=UPI0013D80E3F|nr:MULTISPECIES: hypothetical protein [unclassified Flagellimonas]UII75470.1 hypothetical protein LV716_14560 [Flagellimonas sp. HMM57]